MEMEIFSWRISKIFGLKNVMLFIPFKRCPRQRQGQKINSFCYHVFNFRVMESYKKNDVNLLRLVIHSFF